MDYPAGLVDGPIEGIFVNDSDVFNVVEGAACSLRLHPDLNSTATSTA